MNDSAQPSVFAVSGHRFVRVDDPKHPDLWECERCGERRQPSPSLYESDCTGSKLPQEGGGA